MSGIKEPCNDRVLIYYSYNDKLSKLKILKKFRMFSDQCIQLLIGYNPSKSLDEITILPEKTLQINVYVIYMLRDTEKRLYIMHTHMHVHINIFTHIYRNIEAHTCIYQ